jgi:hypothetical protein
MQTSEGERKPFFTDESLSDEGLKDRFGLVPPELYVRFVRWIYEEAKRDQSAASRLFLNLTDLYVDGAMMLYPMTPRELFAIGSTGGDGEHLGFVHYDMPAQKEYSWVKFDPTAPDCSWILANSTEGFLSQLLSVALAKDSAVKDTAVRCGQVLGIPVSAEIAKGRTVYGYPTYWESGGTQPELVVDLSPGWRLVPTRDGMGVIGKAEQFGPGPHDLKHRRQTFAEYAARITATLDAGHAGTAAWLLRMTPPFSQDMSAYGKEWEQLGELADRTYAEFGRPLIRERLKIDPMW